MGSQFPKTKTYSTESRVLRAVEKFNSEGPGGTNVKYLISKARDGRYFPVFLTKVSKEGAEVLTSPQKSAN